MPFFRGPRLGMRMAPRPLAPRPVVVAPRPVVVAPRRFYHPIARAAVTTAAVVGTAALVAPLFYRRQQPVPQTVVVQAPTTPQTNETMDFPQILGQFNYLMENARQDSSISTQDIEALSIAIDRAQHSDANGVLNAIHGMSPQLLEQARQAGMTYLLQLAAIK